MSETDYRVTYLDLEGDPMAVFLDSADDCNPGHLMTYLEVGEHSEGHLDLLADLPPAAPEKFERLHRYLAARYADARYGDPLNLVLVRPGDAEVLTQ